jgi:16S rRNA (uracil1498-N3)-methyltransferase
MSGDIATRLHVEDDLSQGAVIGLDHARAHYLRAVLRLERGAGVALFNGRDGVWFARIEGLGKGWASLIAERLLQPQRPEPDLWLCFAPIKRARLDFLTEKASELGASRLVPVMTRHTIVSRVNRARLSANAREAAEQCERLSVPEVAEAVDLGRLIDGGFLGRRLYVCAESGAARPLGEVLLEERQRQGSRPPAPAAFLTGPEGGFAQAELDLLARQAFVTPVGLGPRILRADTAGLAALSCWQALLGDAKERPPAERALAGRESFQPLPDENE